MKIDADRSLRIAVVIRHFVSTGGAEKYCVELTRQLAQEHEVHVFAQSFEEGQIPGVQNHRIRQWVRKPRFINQWLFALESRIAVGKNFDIVHSHDMLSYADVYTLHVPCFRTSYSKASGMKWLTLWLKTLLSPRLLSYYMIEAMQFSTRSQPKFFVAVSDYMRRNIELNYPEVHDHIFTAYPGLESGVIAPASMEQRGQIRRELGLSNEAFVCLFIANDFKKKGLGALLEALGHIGKDGILLVVGSGNPESYRSRIQKLGLERQVHFLGSRPNLTPLFVAADALVHPTQVDTFGMVVLEAMAHGLPVIVSNAHYCGISEQLSKETALLLKDPRDSIEIARCIEILMSDGRLRTKLACNARRFASSASWERTAEATLQAYRALERMQESRTG